MPEKRTDTADISFVIKAVIYWLLTAIPALLLASAALSLTNADGAKFAYASAAVSFIAAAAAGAEAARTRGKGSRDNDAAAHDRVYHCGERACAGRHIERRGLHGLRRRRGKRVAEKCWEKKEKTPRKKKDGKIDIKSEELT